MPSRRPTLSALLLSLIVVTAVSACGSDTASEETTTPTSAIDVSTSTSTATTELITSTTTPPPKPSPSTTQLTTSPPTTTPPTTITPTTITPTTITPTTITPTTTAEKVSLISDIACGDPIPIGTMPDGAPTTEPLVDGSRVTWSSGDPAGSGDNIVIQLLEGASEADIAAARSAEITFAEGPLTVNVLPSTSVSDAADIYVFDETTECVRLINTNPFVPDDVLDQYAQTLLAAWTAS